MANTNPSAFSQKFDKISRNYYQCKNPLAYALDIMSSAMDTVRNRLMDVDLHMDKHTMAANIIKFIDSVDYTKGACPSCGRPWSSHFGS